VSEERSRQQQDGPPVAALAQVDIFTGLGLAMPAVQHVPAEQHRADHEQPSYQHRH
jgi:hypothetical protein